MYITQARGDQCENCGAWLDQTELIDPKCKLCGTTPVVKEQHIGTSRSGIISSDWNRTSMNETKEMVGKIMFFGIAKDGSKDGLKDRAVTRDLNWGVHVPVAGYEDKVIYVWFDAVLGYISSGKEWAAAHGKPEAWKEYWQNEDTKYVAFIGKDNVVFSLHRFSVDADGLE